MKGQSQYRMNSILPPPSAAVQSGILQRKCASCSTHTIAGDKCEDCENKQGTLQRKSSDNSAQPQAPPIVHEVLNSSGQPLDKSTRDFFESRFEPNFSRIPVSRQLSRSSLTIGESTNVYEQEADRAADSVMLKEKHENESSANKRQGEKFDLSRVRIHTDARAAASARAVNSLAYTVGNNIVFGAGQFEPGTQAGRRLIAHELTHVAQQCAGRGEGFVMREEPKNKPKPAAPKPAPPPTKIDFDEEEDQPKQTDPKDKAPAGQQTGAPAAKDEHSLFFQDPKVANAPKDPKLANRAGIFVESELSLVKPDINIRFAYPASEMSTEPSAKVKSAKTKILNLIAEVIKDIGNFEVPKEDFTRVSQERARLGEAFREWTTAKPLNIFIATLPNQAEMVSGKFVPTTDTVYIDAKDIGDKSKLEAAIRIPLENLTGSISPKTGKKEPAIPQDELKDAVLHEALHAMLIKKGVGSDAQWEKLKSGKFKISGPPDAQAKGEEIVRKFLIAQDEVFVYETVATQYKPSAKDNLKGQYESFIKNAKSFLVKRGGAMTKAKFPISVSEKVDKKTVSWSITYEFPGSITLTAEDIKVIDVILIAYPNN